MKTAISNMKRSKVSEMEKPTIKQLKKQKTYVSECGYEVKCENVGNGQVCMHTKDINHVTLTKKDIVELFSRME